MRHDWYRNTTWNEAIEEAFNEKLHRARRKEQYLRIQAGILAKTYPEVALQLLDRYFAMGDKFDHAQAFVDRAGALVTLGRIDDAIESYDASLKREAEFPNCRTEAYLDLPCLIAERKLRSHYSRAIQVLEANNDRALFPVYRFRWHAAHAMIAADFGQTIEAKTHAENALSEIGVEHSGLRYHPTIGLVTERYEGLIEQLKQIAGK